MGQNLSKHGLKSFKLVKTWSEMFQHGLKNGLKVVHRCLNSLNGSKMVKLASLLVKSGVENVFKQRKNCECCPLSLFVVR